MKRTTVALLATAVLLSSAGPANAATRQLSANIDDENGEAIGKISLTVNVKKGVARSVTKVKLRNLVPTCGEDEPVPGDPIDVNLKGTYKTKAERVNGTKVRSFKKNKAKGRNAEWRISGSLNKRGTKLFGGRISTSDVGDDCTVKGGFSVE